MTIAETTEAHTDREYRQQCEHYQWPEGKMSSPRARQVAAEIAEDAANMIARYGWIKGKYGDPLTGMCAMGAIQAALWEVVLFSAEFDALYYELRRAFWNLHKVANIPTWNDALPDEDGQKIVVSALKTVAAHLAIK